MAAWFTDDILSVSPSRKDGIQEAEEKLHRIYGCELIQEAGILLKLPQVVMVTGQIVLHRFFYRRSLQNDDAFTVAMGSVLIASKIEEKQKILREIVLVFHYMYQKRNNLKIENLVLGGQRYNQWKDALAKIERIILKELGFIFYNTIDQPHKYIIYMVNMLDGSETLAQKAWNYLNDSMRLDLILRYCEEVIACSAVFMAARFLKVPLPEDGDFPWWKLFVPDISTIYNICGRILELYELPKLSWLTPIHIPEYLAAEISTITNVGTKGITTDEIALQKHGGPPPLPPTPLGGDNTLYVDPYGYGVGPPPDIGGGDCGPSNGGYGSGGTGVVDVDSYGYGGGGGYAGGGDCGPSNGGYGSGGTGVVDVDPRGLNTESIQTFHGVDKNTTFVSSHSQKTDNKIQNNDDLVQDNSSRRRDSSRERDRRRDSSRDRDRRRDSSCERDRRRDNSRDRDRRRDSSRDRYKRTVSSDRHRKGGYNRSRSRSR